LVIVSIHEGNHRFESIQSSLDIARNILTDRLTTLVDNNLVRKVEYSSRPRRFEYHLTDAALELIPISTILKSGEPSGSATMMVSPVFQRRCSRHSLWQFAQKLNVHLLSFLPSQWWCR